MLIYFISARKNHFNVIYVAVSHYSASDDKVLHGWLQNGMPFVSCSLTGSYHANDASLQPTHCKCWVAVLHLPESVSPAAVGKCFAFPMAAVK